MNIEDLHELEAKSSPKPWSYHDSDESICDADGKVLFYGWANEKLQGNDNDWSDMLVVVHARNILSSALAVVDEAAKLCSRDEHKDLGKAVYAFQVALSNLRRF